MPQTILRTGLFLSLFSSITLIAFLSADAPVKAKQTYIVQGRNLAHVSEVVNHAGGVIIQNLGIINAVSARLDEQQVKSLKSSGDIRAVFADRNVSMSSEGGFDEHFESEPDTEESDYGDESEKEKEILETHYPSLTNANWLHRYGYTGQGVTVAVLDTGIWKAKRLAKTRYGIDRVVAQYDVIKERKDPNFYQKHDYKFDIKDQSGHGTHVSSIILSSAMTEAGQYNGIAPGADLVSVKAFDKDGVGTYSDVIRGLDWIVTNRERYDIQVLNLSFSAMPKSLYWEDPLNQAVMRAWEAGIVVVVSAGNTGPDPMTIGVPANIPYVITVGAMTDNYTPSDPSDDKLAAFSSVGPTVEGFVKPEIVAPGGHMLGAIDPSSNIAKKHKEFLRGKNKDYISMSGTSQSTAVVSGIAALMLQADSELSPDDIKCRLMSSSQAAVNTMGQMAYSIFQQGAGIVNAYDAFYSRKAGCANTGLNIEHDLNDEVHYGGRANQDDAGNFYIMPVLDSGSYGDDDDGRNDQYSRHDRYNWNDNDDKDDRYNWNDKDDKDDRYGWDDKDDQHDWDHAQTSNSDNPGYLWDGTYDTANGYTWNGTQQWQNGFSWSDAYLWFDTSLGSDAYLWFDAYFWFDAYLWFDAYVWFDTVAESANVNAWVSQE